jgi:hypothetical protein
MLLGKLTEHQGNKHSLQSVASFNKHFIIRRNEENLIRKFLSLERRIKLSNTQYRPIKANRLVFSIISIEYKYIGQPIKSNTEFNKQ